MIAIDLVIIVIFIFKAKRKLLDFFLFEKVLIESDKAVRALVKLNPNLPLNL